MLHVLECYLNKCTDPNFLLISFYFLAFLIGRFSGNLQIMNLVDIYVYFISKILSQIYKHRLGQKASVGIMKSDRDTDLVK